MFKSAEEILFDSIKEKYFQHKSNHDVVYAINAFGPPIEDSDPSFLAYSPVLKRQVRIPYFELSNYIEITKEKFEDLVKQGKLELLSQNNKANLSAKSS